MYIGKHIEAYFLRWTVERHLKNVDREVGTISLSVELYSSSDAFECHLHSTSQQNYTGTPSVWRGVGVSVLV